VTNTTITKCEREELGRVVRRPANASIYTLATYRRAEFEAQLSTIHESDKAQWKEIPAHALCQV
jgi:hypothetical protein